MNLHWIDWIIVIITLGALISFTIKTSKYNKTVADFLAANRCAGRYLITTAEGAAGVGAITLIAYWEVFYKAGFNVLWWQSMLIPVGLVMSLSGWVTYRYRQTRAMTMAQFFEMRYSRNFRIFSGMLAWLSGIINYGIAPAVTARCLIYFCGLPLHTTNIGGLEIDLTMALVMFIMLTIALTITFMGGHITVLVTDFCQSQLLNITFLIVLVFLLTKFGWGNIVETLKQAPEGESMLNPFVQQNQKDFNFWYFIMFGFMTCYSHKAWQGTQGYNCSAKTPQEAKMAGILAHLRFEVVRLLYVCVPICVYVVLRNPNFSGLSQNIHVALSSIFDSKIQEQMTVSIGLINLLPIGIVGLMAASLIAASISSDDTYLHSWGSIFIQDVVIPLRKKPLSPQQHIRWLRYSILGVAVFIWIFSMIFPLKEYIVMYFMITAAIYLGGAGAVIVGGLYWRRGTTAGAWAGMTVGCILSVTGIILINIFWPNILPRLKELHPTLIWLQKLPEILPFNGMQMSFFAAISASGSYIIVSLLTKPDPDFDMDRMLHRGKYAIKEDYREVTEKPKLIFKLLGISKEFTKGDKITYFVITAISLFWFFTFLIGTILYSIFGASDDTWAKWWIFRISFSAIIAFITTIWFLCGGIKDLAYLFRTLKTTKENNLDDGTVIGHHNAADDCTEGK